jgi:uncharacterized protein YbjQ (UPF0145 family)
MKKILVITVLAVAAIGCSSSTTSDPNLDAWTREVTVITPNQVGDRQYEEISGLEEQQRIGVSGEDDAISTAKQRLRRRAAKLDADAVVIIACGRSVRTIDDNPMPTTEPMVICHGVAIRWKDN